MTRLQSDFFEELYFSDELLTISMNSFLKKPELSQLIILILREYVFCALIMFVAILSIESILPGTTSLQMSTLFFIISITGALLIERTLLSRATFPQKIKKTPPIHSRKISMTLFFLWVVFVLANASLRFPIPILFLLLVSAIFIIVFLVSLFSKKNHATSK